MRAHIEWSGIALAPRLGVCPADGVGHPRSAAAGRLWRAGRTLARGLMLDFRVELAADDDDQEPHPGRKADDRAERTIGLVEVPKVRCVPREEAGGGELGSRCEPADDRPDTRSSAQTWRKPRVPAIHRRRNIRPNDDSLGERGNVSAPRQPERNIRFVAVRPRGGQHGNRTFMLPPTLNAFAHHYPASAARPRSCFLSRNRARAGGSAAVAAITNRAMRRSDRERCVPNHGRSCRYPIRPPALGRFGAGHP
jgi:hypothetical protein